MTAPNYRKFLPPVKVENMTTHTGGTAPNQFIIDTADAIILQSYSSIVAIKLKGAKWNEPQVIIGRNWEYSNTTMKYVGQFLGHGAAETRKRIKNGTYYYEEKLK